MSWFSVQLLKDHLPCCTVNYIQLATATISYLSTNAGRILDSFFPFLSPTCTTSSRLEYLLTGTTFLNIVPTPEMKLSISYMSIIDFKSLEVLIIQAQHFKFYPSTSFNIDYHLWQDIATWLRTIELINFNKYWHFENCL